MACETACRWIVDGGAHSTRFREKERIVNAVVIPILQSPTVRELASDYLVSKRRGSEVWLTIFTREETAAALHTAVEPRLGDDGWRQEPDDADDPLLEDGVRSYRRRLRQVTDVALELHRDPNLVEHQMFLIQAACGADDHAPDLSDHLYQYSPTYAAIPDEEKGAFWRDFHAPGPAVGLEPPSHILWNLVVGCQPEPGGNPAAVADLIGLA